MMVLSNCQMRSTQCDEMECYRSCCLATKSRGKSAGFNRRGVAAVSFAVVILLCLIILGYLATALLLSGNKSGLETFDRRRSSQFFYVPVEESMNSSVDPCQDFYSFVCGRWKENVPESKSQNVTLNAFSLLDNEVSERVKRYFVETSSVGTSEKFPLIVNRAIEFYRSCLTAAETKQQYSQTVLDYMRMIGGLPLLGKDNWDEERFDWMLMSSRMQKTLGLETVVGFHITEDSRNSSRNVLLIKAPDLKKETLNDGLMLYCIVTSFNTTLTAEEIMSDMNDMEDLEKELQNLIGAFPKNDSKRMSVSELQLLVPDINWMKMFRSIAEDQLCSPNCVSELDIIEVRDVPYLNAVSGLIANETSKRTVANLFGWYAIQKMTFILPRALMKYAQYNNFKQEETMSLVKEECYKKASSIFEIALDYLFIRFSDHFDVRKSSEIVFYLKRSFESMIESSLWMDTETKSHAIAKLEAMHETIGYNSFFNNISVLDETFSDFPIMERDIIRNYIASSNYFVQKQISTLLSVNNYNTMWLPRSIISVGAYYNLNQNSIVFPLSLYNPPFFYPAGPGYMNFGAIGYLIGHEITHGYDALGQTRDENGNMCDCWTNQTIINYNKKIACFEKQFDKYKIPGSDVFVDGKRTINENIADAVGLKQAYSSYKEWQQNNIVEGETSEGLKKYTPDQMFFISYASVWCGKSYDGVDSSLRVHSPRKLRVIGTLSNSAPFSEAFSCESGSPMNPKEKCSIW